MKRLTAEEFKSMSDAQLDQHYAEVQREIRQRCDNGETMCPRCAFAGKHTKIVRKDGFPSIAVVACELCGGEGFVKKEIAVA